MTTLQAPVYKSMYKDYPPRCRVCGEIIWDARAKRVTRCKIHRNNDVCIICGALITKSCTYCTDCLHLNLSGAFYSYRGICTFPPCGNPVIGKRGKRYCTKRCQMKHYGWRRIRGKKE